MFFLTQLLQVNCCAAVQRLHYKPAASSPTSSLAQLVLLGRMVVPKNTETTTPAFQMHMRSRHVSLLAPLPLTDVVRTCNRHPSTAHGKHTCSRIGTTASHYSDCAHATGSALLTIRPRTSQHMGASMHSPWILMTTAPLTCRWWTHRGARWL